MVDCKGLFQFSHLFKTHSCSHSREIGQEIWGRERQKRGEGWREGGAGSVLLSMNAEASADLHRSRHLHAVGWLMQAGRGGPAWVWQPRGVGVRAPPPPRPHPLLARARASASCKWRAPRQMRSSGSGFGKGGSSWHLPPLLSGGSRGTEAPSGRPPASHPKPRGLLLGEEGAARNPAFLP